MQATEQEIELLGKLAKIDTAITQLDKQLGELPQRAQIGQIRAKIAQIEEKAQAVGKLKADAEKKLALAIDEDERLAAKQVEIQESLESQKGGFRDVEARTKEMNGYAKRRKTLESELVSLEAELTRIESMERQIGQLLTGHRDQEARLTGEFREIGGGIQAKAKELRQARALVVEHIGKQLMGEYEKALKRCGGMAIAHLEGECCSVCRSQVGPGQKAKVRAEAPISLCPSCKRLLVVR